MQSTIYAADYVYNQDPETNVVRVRPASLEDEEGLRRMLSRLSRESVYLRFHAPLPRRPSGLPPCSQIRTAGTASLSSPSQTGDRRPRHVRAV